MKNIVGNLWKFHKEGKWVVIPTNGYITRDGSNIMGALAGQAASIFPDLPRREGEALATTGVVPHFYPEYRIVTFPTMWEPGSDADTELMEESAKDMMAGLSAYGIDEIYLPEVGCGVGGLSWREAEELLEPYLDDRVIAVHLK